MIETICFYGQTLAIILHSRYKNTGVHFFTPDSFSQQLGYMRHPSGHSILPHDHNPVPRTIEWTQEVLVIRSGKVRLDIYSPDREYLESHILESGDVVLLAHGGHGFVMLEESEIIEVKQGPYAGEADKQRFEPIDESEISIKPTPEGE
jgi:mannose-6-phosphate isomerase-like protein (cupin superfamily)